MTEQQIWDFKHSLFLSKSYEDHGTVQFQLGFREAITSVLAAMRLHGPELTARSIALAVKSGNFYAPSSKDDARWVLENIDLTQPQEVGL